MFEMMPFGHCASSAVSYDPFRMFDEIERSFFGSQPPVSGFRTDIIDAGDAYRLEAELPGFRKEDLNLSIENDILTVSAERSLDNSEEKPNIVKRERFYGAFSRSFDISGINADAIDAEYTDGILKILLPKKAAELPASRRLEIR